MITPLKTIMKHFLILSTLVLFFSCKTVKSVGQESKINKKAETYYNESVKASFGNTNIEESITLLQKALSIEPEYIKALSLLSQIYQSEKQDYIKAIVIYDRIIKADADNIMAYYNKAICEFNLKKHEESKNTIEKYLSFSNVTGKYKEKGLVVLHNIEFCKMASFNESSVSFINLGSNINSKNDEYFPSVTSDNKFLYFTFKNKNDNYPSENIYFSEFLENNWSKNKRINGDVNSNYNEGAHCVSSNGKYLLFASDNRRYENLGRFDIFIAKKVGNTWKKPNNMGRNINSYTWDSQPVLSADSKQLLFVSTRKGGLGGADIYISTIDESGRFGEAVNIGDVINTPFNEQRPYLHPDGKTLYFASDGHPGFGASDLYKSTKDENGKWTKPINLGYPINTSGVEFGIFVSANGEKGFVSSDREGGYGGQDIYSFEMPDAIKPNLVSYITGVVSDDENSFVKANIKLFDLSNGNIVKTFSSDEINGKFLETIIGEKDYALVAEAHGYLPFSENISLSKLKHNESFVFDITLEKIEKGKEITLKNIFFNTGKFELLEISKVELNYFVGFLAKNSQLNIEVGGNTDNVGSVSMNQILSENRAKEVMNYLIEKGINSERLKHVGYGDSKPIATNDSEKGRALNRRTSFTIL